MSFKVGDRVRVVESSLNDLVPVGTEGTVKMVASEHHYFIDTPTHPDFLGFGWPLTDEEFETVEVAA